MSAIEFIAGHVLGCDLGDGPTFSVYLGGEAIAAYNTEAEASEHYALIRQCGLPLAKERGLLAQTAIA